jgi:hypothetical protein
MLHGAQVEYTGLENRDRFPHKFVFPNGSEVVARESQNLGRWLGQDFGWFYVDEAQEEPEQTFKGLVSRLRLPHAGRYLKGILTTNPPTDRHWIARLFGLEEGFKTLGKSTYHLIKSATKENPHLPSGYLDDLVATHSKAEAKRVVDGDYGFISDGPPVMPQFKPEHHVGFADPDPRVPLIRGWDFGFRHPAVTWHQIVRCRQNEPHWFTYAELDAQEIETEGFADLVEGLTRQLFPDFQKHMILEAGDGAGASVNERGPGPILRLGMSRGYQWRYTKLFDIDPSLDFIRTQLEKPKCKCGRYLVEVHRRCRHLIDGWLGGYHCPPNRPSDKPVKDGFYDDICDSARYAIWNYLRREVLGFDDAREYVPQSAQRYASPWEWMDPYPSEDQMIAEISRIKGLTTQNAP